MIVTEKLTGSALVDVTTSRTEQNIEYATGRLVRQLIRTADERAYKVREESVYVRRVDGEPGKAQDRLEAIWSPLEARFVGGEYDGDTRKVRRESDGLPLAAIILPYRSAPQYGESSPQASIHPVYDRSGIDPIADCWVYTARR